MAKNNTQDQLINLQAQQLAAQVANWAAQLDFQKARFNQLELPEWQQKSQLEVDQFAWTKAQDTWENAYKEALVTGTYQGQPTIDWLTRQAQLTGVLDGQQTLQGKLTDAQITQMNQQMKLANDQFLANATGYLADGTPTFDREQWMANTTGYTATGNPTFAREQWQAAQAVTGWQFLSTLSGPQNAFKQANAIQNMPPSMASMMDVWAGTYTSPGSTEVGSGGRASLSDMRLGYAGQSVNPPGDYSTADSWGSVTGANTVSAHHDYSLDPGGINNPLPAPQPPATVQAASGPAYTYSPPGVQAPAQAWNYTPLPSGSVQVHPPGVASPPETPDISTTTPQNPGTIASTLAAATGGAYSYGSQPTPTQAVPTTGIANPSSLLPNQINAENYRNMYDYQKQLGWAGFEDAGWDKGLAQEAFKKSLPTYVNPTQGKIAAF